MGLLNLGAESGRYPPELLDHFSGRKLVVVGGGRCVWQDLLALNVSGDEPNGWDILTVNDVTMHYDGKVTHCYSNDDRWLPRWIAARRELINRQFGLIEYLHTCNHGASYNWPWPGHGSSALGAVYTGLAMGYDPVVLCGVPLDDSGHYFDPPWKKTNFSREVGLKGNGEMMYWQGAKNRIFEGRVKSMSGRTRELLGTL